MSVRIARKILFTDAVFDFTKALCVGTSAALVVTGSVLDNTEAVRGNTVRISVKLLWCESAREQNEVSRKVCWRNPAACRPTVWRLH